LCFDHFRKVVVHVFFQRKTNNDQPEQKNKHYPRNNLLQYFMV
jgi:hypothetical protein